MTSLSTLKKGKGRKGLVFIFLVTEKSVSEEKTTLYSFP